MNDDNTVYNGYTTVFDRLSVVYRVYKRIVWCSYQLWLENGPLVMNGSSSPEREHGRRQPDAACDCSARNVVRFEGAHASRNRGACSFAPGVVMSETLGVESANAARSDVDAGFGRPFWFSYAANLSMMVSVSLLFVYAEFIKSIGG